MRPQPAGLMPRPPGRWLADRSSMAAATFGAVGAAGAVLYGVSGVWSVHEAALILMAVATFGAMAGGLRLNAPPRRGPWEVLFLGAVLLALGGWVRLDRHTLGAIDAHRAL